MKTTSLGKSKKAVLYADIAYPEFTDAELSKIIGISPGRISTIRSHLTRDAYYREIKVPALDLLGFEGIGAVLLELRNAHLVDNASGIKAIEELVSNPNVFYAIENNDHLFMIAAFPRLVSFEAFADEAFEVGSRIGSGDCEETFCSFPLDISRIHSFWDFSSVLHSHFRLQLPQPQRIMSMGKTIKHPELKIDEIRILDLMIRYPIANDSELARRADVSLSTFRRVKERMLAGGLCRRAFVPDITKMGFELFGFMLVRLNPCRSKIGEVDHIRSLVSPWPFLLMSRKSRALIGHCFRDYTSFANYSSSVIRELKKGSVHLNIMKTLQCSTLGMRELKPLNFSGLLSTLLPFS